MPPTMGNGKICYLLLPASDVARSAAFYQTVFGWPIRKRGDGTTSFDDGVGQVSGAFVTGRQPETNPGMLLYVMVDSAAATIEKITANGGRVVEAVVPGAREVTALFADPEGNVLGIYQDRA